jgi:hypothetical protein
MITRGITHSSYVFSQDTITQDTIAKLHIDTVFRLRAVGALDFGPVSTGPPIHPMVR